MLASKLCKSIKEIKINFNTEEEKIEGLSYQGTFVKAMKLSLQNLKHFRKAFMWVEFLYNLHLYDIIWARHQFMKIALLSYCGWFSKTFLAPFKQITHKWCKFTKSQYGYNRPREPRRKKQKMLKEQSIVFPSVSIWTCHEKCQITNKSTKTK